MILKNKTIILTGASDGLGKHLALKLAKEGASLALIARDKTRLEEVKRLVEEEGSPEVRIYTCDIVDVDQIADTMRQIEVDFKEYQILLNIAGVWQKLNNLEDILEDEVDTVLDVNLKGLINITRIALPVLKRQKEASIINDSSRSGVTAQAGQSVYTAAKWGVTGFTEELKQELKGTSVHVAGLYQGGTDTKLFEKVGEHFNQEKFIKPEDLADVVVFMLSRPPQIWLHDVRVEN